MLSVKKSNGLLILFCLFAAVTANASPTISCDSSNLIVCTKLTGTVFLNLHVSKIYQTNEPYDTLLAPITDEFLKPPADFAISAPTSKPVKSLPGVPGALLMVITGFLCVSLIKDRKFWLAASAGLFWLGQAGLTTLPQLVSYIASKKHIEQQSSPNVTYVPGFDNSCRLCNHIEDTQYIGLLHYLAGIPDSRSKFEFANRHLAKLVTVGQHCRNSYTKVCNYQHKNTYTSQFNIILERYKVLLYKYRASITKQTALYSPAFIFPHLGRGPPMPP